MEIYFYTFDVHILCGTIFSFYLCIGIRRPHFAIRHRPTRKHRATKSQQKYSRTRREHGTPIPLNVDGRKKCPSAAPPKPAENSAAPTDGKKASAGRTTETGKKFGSTDRRQKGVRRPPHRDRQKIRHAPADRKKVSATPTHFTTIPPTISPTSHPNERPRTENHGAFPSHPNAICQRTRRGSRHHLQHL